MTTAERQEEAFIDSINVSRTHRARQYLDDNLAYFNKCRAEIGLGPVTLQIPEERLPVQSASEADGYPYLL